MNRALGLYVHVPFCARVCPYCDFAVQTGGPAKRAGYVRSLLAEIEGAAEAFPDTPVDTVFLGGGTPSSLAPDSVEEILVALRSSLSIPAAADLTLEANPEDVTAGNPAAWRRLGVSRLSLGVQSFHDDDLAALGREHTREQAIEAVQASLEAGFEAVSLDLIYAVPGQTTSRWEATLRQAVELQPHHISCYELTVHQGTRFYRDRERGRLAELTDDAKAEQFFLTHRLLAAAGYPAYEVSNFARSAELRSRHNSKYWDHSPYIGFGPSAHSFDGDRRRWWNERRLTDWQEALAARSNAIGGEESLSNAQLVLERLALGLRTAAGIDLREVESRYGVEVGGANADYIERLEGDGLLIRRGSNVTPTLEGMAVADTLAAGFEIPG